DEESKPRPFYNLTAEALGKGSCWLNAALQLLLAVPAFTDLFRSEFEREQLRYLVPQQHGLQSLWSAAHFNGSVHDQENKQIRVASGNGASTLDRLAVTHHATIQGRSADGKDIRGKSLLPLLFTDVYYTGVQEDAAEFLLREIFTEEKSHLRSLVYGEYSLHRMYCRNPSCTFERPVAAQSQEEQTFVSWELHIPDANTGREDSVQAAIDDYLQPEVMDERFKWNCPKCDSHEPPRKSRDIARMPRVLLLTMNRGKPVLRGDGSVVMELQHTNTFVNKTITVGKTNYTLAANILHSGQRTDEGHYIAIARHGKVYWKYNDSIRREAKATEVEGDLSEEKSGVFKTYILAYSKSEEFSDMGPANEHANPTMAARGHTVTSRHDDLDAAQLHQEPYGEASCGASSDDSGQLTDFENARDIQVENERKGDAVLPANGEGQRAPNTLKRKGMDPGVGDPHPDPKQDEKSGSASSASDGEIESDKGECDYLRVEAKKRVVQPTNEDMLKNCATQLSKELRDRPTLPAAENNGEVSFADVGSYVRLSLFSCPFKNCRFHTDTRSEMIDHLNSTGADSHWAQIRDAYHKHPDWDAKRNPLKLIPDQLVSAAVSVLERGNFPRIGPAVTRRTLRRTLQRYNDKCIRSLVCFICGQQRLTFPDNHTDDIQSEKSDIKMHWLEWFRSIEHKSPGTLANNCGYALWKERYATGANCPPSLLERIPKRDGSDRAYALSEWCIDVDVSTNAHQRVERLFGVTEDITCNAKEHEHDADCRKLCNKCEVPICKECQIGLSQYKPPAERTDVPTATIPMAIANDNFYGYIDRVIVRYKATWLECAASSLVWSTIMVYYLEAPYGHLMLEPMGQAQARTQARGNLFSFQLPWDDIDQCCAKVEEQSQSVLLPHDEDMLATLVHVHIIGGSKDLGEHLAGATLRLGVVREIIKAVRASGYKPYASYEDAKVMERIQELYPAESEHMDTAFMPLKVKEAVEKAWTQRNRGSSLIQEKNQTPSEPVARIDEIERGLRPLSLSATVSSQSVSTVFEEHGTIMSRYGMHVQTGSTMLDQFEPHYLGLAHPLTLQIAVGGPDILGKDRWRRPDARTLGAMSASATRELANRLGWTNEVQAEAAYVRLFDITRGLPQRVEGQYRRHWGFVPGLWNLYFREQVTTGSNLKVSSNMADKEAGGVEQNAAIAAADLYKKLESGYYRTQSGERRRIDNDMSKLFFAEGVTPLQKKLLRDVSFRSRSLPGTQGIRTMIGHVGFW
ncbi:MAG: hypothetical protein NZ577_04010, partial [Vicinamibacterales bacterium]|nr:hypothetical protein [Vicinamibacterales bacterium]